MTEGPRFVEFLDGFYRSPLPLAREVGAFAAVGGRSLIDLTQRPRPTVERAARRFGVAYVKHGLPYDFTAGHIEAAAHRVLLLARPVLIHCFHGRDRTGAVASWLATGGVAC